MKQSKQKKQNIKLVKGMNNNWLILLNNKVLNDKYERRQIMSLISNELDKEYKDYESMLDDLIFLFYQVYSPYNLSVGDEYSILTTTSDGHCITDKCIEDEDELADIRRHTMFEGNIYNVFDSGVFKYLRKKEAILNILRYCFDNDIELVENISDRQEIFSIVFDIIDQKPVLTSTNTDGLLSFSPIDGYYFKNKIDAAKVIQDCLQDLNTILRR